MAPSGCLPSTTDDVKSGLIWYVSRPLSTPAPPLIIEGALFPNPMARDWRSCSNLIRSTLLIANSTMNRPTSTVIMSA